MTNLLLFSSMFSYIICDMLQVGMYVLQPASGPLFFSANLTKIQITDEKNPFANLR